MKESINWDSFCPAPFRRGQHEVYALFPGGESLELYCRACGAGQDRETFFSILNGLGLTGPTSVDQCEKIAATLPCREILVDGELYMRRHYIAGVPTWDHAYDKPLVPRCERPGWSLFLHSFHLPDAERELHNHPWDQSVSLILNGGYTEHRRTEAKGPLGYDVLTRKLKSGDVNAINRDTFHRVVELGSDVVWTVFVTGRRIGDWGFWNEDADTYEHWRRNRALPAERAAFLQEVQP